MKGICMVLFTAMLCFWSIPAQAQEKLVFSLTEDHLLTDQKGRKIKIERPFKRIISLYGAHTENLFFLGLKDEITGVTRSDTYPDQARHKKIFSPKDDPEKFLAENPDLVLIRPMLDRGYAKLFARLEKSGITVISIQPGNIEQMYLYWTILGRLTGREVQAEAMIKAFKQTVQKIQTQTLGIEEKKQVYFEAIHKKMKTFTRGAMADFVLTTAGGVNVAADGVPSRDTNIAIYGKERILEKADRIDVYLAQKGAMNQVTREMIINEPGFQIIKAVKEDRIYFVDEAIVSRPTMRLLTGITKIRNILYPEVSGQSVE